MAAGAVIFCELEDGCIILDPCGRHGFAHWDGVGEWLPCRQSEVAPEMTSERVKAIIVIVESDATDHFNIRTCSSEGIFLDVVVGKSVK